MSLALSPASIGENGGKSTVTATLSGASNAEVTVTVSATPVGGAQTGDFTLSSNRKLTIAAGATASTGTVEITANDNDVDAPDKTVRVSGTASGGGVTNPADQTLTITDDEATPTASLALNPASIGEAGGKSTVTATLSGASSAEVTVTVSATPVGGAQTGDFTLSSNRKLTIAAGATASTGTVEITANDNDVDGPDKTVTVSGTASGGGVTNPADQTLTITDDDGTAAFTVAAASVSEGNSGMADLTFTVSLSPASSSETTVQWATSDGTATEGTDYTAGSGTLTFAAGDTEKTVTVAVTGDVVDEGASETLTLTLSNPGGGAELGTAKAATGTITDDDAAPSGITLSVTPSTVAENVQTAPTVTVKASVNGATRYADAKTVTVEVGATQRHSYRRRRLRDGGSADDRDWSGGGQRDGDVHADADRRRAGRDGPRRSAWTGRPAGSR